MSVARADRPAAPPALWRRLAAMVYEGFLLAGVLMVSGWLYGVLTQQRHALQGRLGLQLFLFAVLAVYFVGFWTHGGQTLAMKTWRLRVVRADGGALSRWRALARYLLSWLWFMPALLAIQVAGLRGGGEIALSLLVGVLAYVLVARLHPQQQFLHDQLCGTRIVWAESARRG